MLQQESTNDGGRLAARIVALILFICAAFIARHANDAPISADATAPAPATVAMDAQPSSDVSQLVRPVRLSSATLRLRERSRGSNDETTARDETAPEQESDVTPLVALEHAPTEPEDIVQDLPQTTYFEFEQNDAWWWEEQVWSEFDRDDTATPSTSVALSSQRQEIESDDQEGVTLQFDQAAPSADPAEAAEPSPEIGGAPDVSESTAQTRSPNAQDVPSKTEQASEVEPGQEGDSKATISTKPTEGLTIRNANKTVGEVRLTVDGQSSTLKPRFMLQYPGQGPWTVQLTRGEITSPMQTVQPGVYTIQDVNGQTQLRRTP